MTQLADLAKPFSDAFIHQKPGQGGGSYVEHNHYVERILLHVGPYKWELVELIRGEFDHKDATKQGVTGAVWRLTLNVDGVEAVYEEVGDVEHPGNWKTDGQRAKDAASDAFKRCCMRAGLGLHLWSGKQYFLSRKLEETADAG